MLLTLRINYDTKTDTFKFDGDIKDERRADLIMEFISTQIGAGEDHSPMAERPEYTITLRWHPDDDSFGVSHNCGNCGLREGLLMEAARRLTAENNA